MGQKKSPEKLGKDTYKGKYNMLKCMNAAKAVIWGNFVAINAFVEKKDIKSIAKSYT